MKAIKGIISAVVAFLVYIIMSVVWAFFMERGLFVYNTLDIFPLNAFGVIVIVMSAFIPIVFLKFKTFNELFIYSVSLYISGKVLYTVFFGGSYALFYTLDYYGIGGEPLAVIPDGIFDAMALNVYYISIGIVAGFISSIAINVIRNISAKKNIKVDDNVQ